MKKSIVILFIFSSLLANSQYDWSDRGTRFSHHFFTGVSAGNEYFISAPKFSYVARFDLLNKYGHSELDKYEFKRFFIYGGAEVSLFVFFVGVFGTSLNGGVQAGYFTLDNSISITHAYYDENTNATKTTYNPKFGIEIGPIWFKSGPSYNLKGESFDFIKINGKQFNFEVLLSFDFYN